MQDSTVDRLIDLIGEYGASADDAARNAAVDAIIDLLGEVTPAKKVAEPIEIGTFDITQHRETLLNLRRKLDASPDAETARYVSAAAELCWRGAYQDVVKDADSMDVLTDIRRRCEEIAEANPEYGREVFDKLVANGALTTDPKRELKIVEGKTVEMYLARQKAIDDYEAESAVLRTEHQARQDVLRDSMLAAGAAGNMEEYRRIDEEWTVQHRAFVDDRLQKRAAVADTFIGDDARGVTLYHQVGQRYFDMMLNQSVVSEADAKAWAESQNVTEGAIRRLKSASRPYPIETLRADMAQLYRLLGGRIGSVCIDTDGKRRAKASGIHGHTSPVIYLGTDFDKRVLFHELAHHLEADPAMLAAAKAFLVKRRKSDKPRKLNAIEGTDRYDSDEIAYEDDFYTAYVGKHYDDATEVFSMGVDSFSNPEALLKRMAKDPEHFALIFGAMRSRPPPMMQGMKKMLQQIGELAAAKEEDEDAQWDAALSAYIADVTLSPGDLGAMEGLGYMLRSYEPGKVLGHWRDIAFVECKKLRDYGTGRQKKGIALLRGYKDGNAGRDDPRDFSRGYSIETAFGGLDWARAKAKAWRGGVHITMRRPSTLREPDA